MPSSTPINRRHTLDETYFDNIDSQEKAYWLGFLWADGNISRTAKRAAGPNRLRLAQKWSEKDHMEKFRTAIASNAPIARIPHEGNHDVAQLDINSRRICDALTKLGYGKKDARTSIPNIPHDLVKHFIRGYFDGDGCLSIYTQTVRKWTILKHEWSITGNEDLLAAIQSILTADAATTATTKLKAYTRSPHTRSLRYGKRDDIVKLYHYLYDNSSIYLDTKHTKFVDFFSKDASRRIAARRSTNSAPATPAP